jgi:hypothetical protein
VKYGTAKTEYFEMSGQTKWHEMGQTISVAEIEENSQQIG